MNYKYPALLVAASMVFGLHAETYMRCTNKIPVSASKKQLTDTSSIQVRIGTPEIKGARTISSSTFIYNTSGRAEKLYFCFDQYDVNKIYVYYNNDKTKKFEPVTVLKEKGQYGGKIIIDVEKATIEVKYNKPKR